MSFGVRPATQRTGLTAISHITKVDCGGREEILRKSMGKAAFLWHRTEWAQAQVDTLRLKLFKIGTLVRVSVRRVLLPMSSAYPWKHLFTHVFRMLSC